ncbi:MAG: PDZ domain-containing protein, partial [Deltaproteobacteria bacterium]|nr:PDZ domain-containing protein [Deltaproteobacteria bacterium]
DRADLIYKVNGKRVNSSDEVEDLIAQSPSGSDIVFTMRRGGIDGREREVRIRPQLQ